MNYIFLFFTHSGAIKFDRKCKKNNIPCELMPVPRVLSSNCSICAQVKLNYNGEKLIDSEVEKMFLCENKENRLIYEAE